MNTSKCLILNVHFPYTLRTLPIYAMSTRIICNASLTPILSAGYKEGIPSFHVTFRCDRNHVLPKSLLP